MNPMTRMTPPYRTKRYNVHLLPIPRFTYLFIYLFYDCACQERGGIDDDDDDMQDLASSENDMQDSEEDRIPESSNEAGPLDGDCCLPFTWPEGKVPVDEYGDPTGIPPEVRLFDYFSSNAYGLHRFGGLSDPKPTLVKRWTTRLRQ